MNSQAPSLQDYDHVMANLEQIWNDLSLEHSHDETMSFFGILVEEDKICDKAWRAQQAHVHRPKEGRAHPLSGPLTERRPRLAHQVSENLFYKDETCSTRMRLALQG